MLIKFRCKCGKKLIVNEEFVGTESQCTRCGKSIVVPSAQEVGNKICPGCGTLVSPEAAKCPNCAGLKAAIHFDSKEFSLSLLIRDIAREIPWFAISAVVHVVFIVLLFSYFSSIKPEKRIEISLKGELVEVEDEDRLDGKDDEYLFTGESGRADVKEDEEQFTKQVAKIADEVPLSEVEEPEEVMVAKPVREAKSDDLDAFGTDLQNILNELRVESRGVVTKGYGTRYGNAKERALKEGGGGENTERAVFEALKWLARHQSRDGRWDTDGFQAQCRGAGCDGQGLPGYDVGVTGLALLAFLGAGNTNIYGGFQKNVAHALEYLASVQDESGLFGNGNMYNHAIATFAVCEALSLNKHLIKSEDPQIRSKLKVKHPLDDAAVTNQMARLKKMAHRAMDYLEDARNPDMAWRYRYRPGDNDTSVTGWAALAVFSAINANIAVKEQTIAGIRNWFSYVTDPESHRVGYKVTGIGSEAMTAVGTVCRLYFGVSKRHPHVVGGVRIMLNRLPRRNDDRGWRVYYWYYGTLAMFQIGGRAWRRWNAALKDCLLSAQRKRGCERGSWPPVDADGLAGGRVYSTAMCALCLEAYYRYPRRKW